MAIIRFRVDPGQAANLRLRAYSRDRATLLATIVSLAGPTPPNPFVEEVAGSYRCDAGALPAGDWFIQITYLDTGEVAADGFATSDDPELRDDAASTAASAIAAQVFTQLAGSRSTILEGPTSVGTPLDRVKTADLVYTIPVATAADSLLLWFIRCEPDAPSAYLEASSSAGLTKLMSISPVTAGHAQVTRVDPTTVRVSIKAAALSQLPSQTVACELRERTAAGDEISRHEVEITLRHSAGRN